MERLITAVKKLLEHGDFYLSAIELDRGNDIDGRDVEIELKEALAEAETTFNKPVTATVTQLRSKSIYWVPEDKRINDIIAQSNTSGVESLSDEDKVHLIKELDRRLIQFWDKVDYENGLPNRKDLYYKPVEIPTGEGEVILRPLFDNFEHPFAVQCLNHLHSLCCKAQVSYSINYQEFDHQWTIDISSAAKEEEYMSRDGPLSITFERVFEHLNKFQG